MDGETFWGPEEIRILEHPNTRWNSILKCAELQRDS